MSVHNANSPEHVATLVQELERRHKTARDFIVPQREIEAVYDFYADPEPTLKVAIPDGSGLGSKVIYDWTPNGMNQTLAHLNVPADYGRRISGSHPSLFNTTINGLSATDKSNRLFRTLDGGLRATLSDRYRVLDNYDLFFNSFKVARDSGAEISRASLSDDRFELRFIVPSWREDIGYTGPGGHQWFGHGESQFVPGAYVSNSETGKGGLSVRPFLLDKVCSNGVILESTLRTIHLGGQQEVGFLSREAAEADSKAIWLRVRDLIQVVFDQERFREIVKRFRETGELKLENPQAAVDAVVKDFGFTDDDRQAILNELISPSFDRDPGRTVFGLISAITFRAQAYEDPERRSELETAAGTLLNDGRARELVSVR